MGVKPELMLRYLDAFKGYPPVAEQIVLFRTWLGDNENRLAHSNVQNMVLTARDESPSKFDVAKLAELCGKAGPNCLANDVLVQAVQLILGKLRSFSQEAIVASMPSRPKE